MSKFYLVQGDTEPALPAQLLDENGNPIPLTGLSITFNMGNTVKESPVEIVDANQAQVKYSWKDGDTDKPGVWKGQFVITTGAGRQRTVPSSDEDPLEIIIAKRV